MMAAVQSPYTPSFSPTMTMLQTPRPSSSEAFQSQQQGQQHQRSPQAPRNMQYTQVGGMAGGNYRQPATAPYAFAATPNPLRQNPTVMPHPRLENRTASAPSVPMLQQLNTQSATTSSRPRPPAVTAGNTPLNPSHPPQISLKQSPTIIDNQSNSSRPLSTLDFNPPSMSYANVAKSSPDRYRRNHRRAETGGALKSTPSFQGGSAMPSGSGMATVGHLYTHPTQTSSTPTLTTYPSYHNGPSPGSSKEHDSNASSRLASKDDMNVQRQSSSELAKRYRRRSISSLEAKDYAIEAQPTQPTQPKTYAAMLAGPAPSEKKENRPATLERPTSSHGRNASAESSTSGRSSSRPASVRLSSLPDTSHDKIYSTSR